MLAKFFRQSLFVQCWTLPVWLLLGAAKIAIFCSPFSSFAGRLGTPLNNSWIPLLTPAQAARAKKISTLIQGVAPYTPWDSNCFPQAITARILLGLYGIPGTFFFGVHKEGEKMEAHAWVCSGRVRVTGGYSFNYFAVVGSYLFTIKHGIR
jgi:hypothetical protein